MLYIMEVYDLGHSLLVSLYTIVLCLRSIASFLLTCALAVLGFLIILALVLTSVWLYVHAVILLFEYCHFVLRDIIRYISSWFASLHPSTSFTANAIEDIATSVKDEPNDDDDNNDNVDFPPLNDSSPRASVSSLNHRTPPQSPRPKPRESATRFAIIASAFPSEQRDQSLTPPYICDEYQCTFPYPCTEPRAKKPRNASRAVNSSS